MVQHTASWYYKNNENVMSEVRDKNPSLSNKDLKSLLSQQWKTLTPNEKAPFERMVILSKEEALDLELDEVPPVIDTKKTNTPSYLVEEEEIEEEIEEEVEEEVKEENPKSLPNELKEGQKYKQAKSSFMHYLYDDKVRSQYPEYKGKELTKHLSKLWNEMNESDKKPWKELHEKEKDTLKENPVVVFKKQKKPKMDELDKIASSLQLIKDQLKDLQTQIQQFSQ